MAKAGHHNIPAEEPTSRPDIPNPGAEGISYYTPAQNPVAGTALSANPPGLFTPLKIRGLTLQNRIMVKNHHHLLLLLSPTLDPMKLTII